MDITILIINWNSGDYLRKLLVSLAGLAGRISGVIVLDNGSGDHSPDCLADFPEVLFEPLGSNLGFSAAVNLGFRRAGSKYVLLVNPDVEFESCLSTVTDLYKTAESFSDAAIVTCPLYSLGPGGDEPQTEFQVRPYPSVCNTLADLLFIDEMFSRPGRKKRAVLGLELEAGVVELSGQPAAALWLVRKSAWQEAGGLDERFYPAWFEDVDFCLRIKESGWKLLYTEVQGRVFHKGGSSLESLGFPRFLKLYYRNLLRFWGKHHACYLPVIAPAAVAGCAARRFISFIRRRYAKNR